MEDSEVPPIEGAYAWTAPGQSLQIAQGQGEVGSQHVTDLTLELEFTYDLDVRWSAQVDADMEETRLVFQHPTFGPSNASMVVTNVTGSGSNARSCGVLQPVAFQDATDPVRVIAHVFNGPDVLGSEVTTRREAGYRHVSRSRIRCESGGWALILDARPDLSAALADAKAAQSTCMTHVAEICRLDGSAFTADQAQCVVDAIGVALSFASGRSTPVALGVGWDEQGLRVWESWKLAACDALAGPRGFLNKHRPEDLIEVLKWCMEWHSDFSVWEPVRRTIFYYIDALTDGLSAEGSMLLSAAGLDLLWTTRPPTLSTATPANAGAHTQLRELLQHALVDTAVPSHLSGLIAATTHLDLRGVCLQNADGPCLVTGLRNEFAHPRLEQSVYGVRSAARQGRDLQRHYLELLILHRIGYRGEYVPRLRPGGSSTSSIPVPW